MKPALLCLLLFSLPIAGGESDQYSEKLASLPAGEKWDLVWSDEFNGAKLDETRWGIIGVYDVIPSKR